MSYYICTIIQTVSCTETISSIIGGEIRNLVALTISIQHHHFTFKPSKKYTICFSQLLQSIFDNSVKMEALYMLASTSGSLSIGAAGTLLLPLKREDILSMAEFSWPIFSFKVCLVLCFQEQHHKNNKKHHIPMTKNIEYKAKEA